MSWFTWDKKNERKEYAETVTEEKQQEHPSPLSSVGTTHTYRISQQRAYGISQQRAFIWSDYTYTLMSVQYRPVGRSVVFSIGEQSIELNEQQFKDLRVVLRAFAHDPKFNESTEELV